MLQDFENKMAESPIDYEQNIRIAESMLKLAFAVGALPNKDPLDGIEHDIHLAKVLRSVSRTIKENP